MSLCAPRKKNVDLHVISGVSSNVVFNKFLSTVEYIFELPGKEPLCLVRVHKNPILHVVQNQRIGFYLNNEQQLQNEEDKYIIINVDQLLIKANYINCQNRSYYIVSIFPSSL